jgi:amino-acid N-acetyltransferase
VEERAVVGRDRDRSGLTSEIIEEKVARTTAFPRFKVHKAKMGDASDIYRLVSGFAIQNEMLQRPLAEIYENLRDFFVATTDNRIIACCALHICDGDLAELKAFAVVEDWQRRGIGTKLIQACLDEAKELGIGMVFALTSKPGVFEKLGYFRPDVGSLPRVVWGECHRCAKFPKFCDEVAVAYQVIPAKQNEKEAVNVG